MVWVPIIIGRRRRGSSKPGAVIAGVLLFLVFGIIFFLLLNRSGFMGFTFPIIFWMIGIIMLFIVIFGISIAASEMSKKPEIPKINSYNYKQNSPQKNDHYSNPYIIKAPDQKKSDPSKQNEIADTNYEMNEVNFCRYCGAKVDRKAKFCYQCGSKL